MATFSERLKQLRLEAHLTQEELAEKLGVSKGAIGNYETGAREPNRMMQDAIADLFNVELDYLNGRNNTRPEYTIEEKWLIECYRKTDDDMKEAVKTVLRRFGEKAQSVAEEKRTKVIPLFPAAAGPGEPIEGNAFDEYETAEEADFAIKVSGDSMEPYFHDGQIVLCKRAEVSKGDIAVIMVNGLLLVKQFIPGYAGQWYLRSLNRARSDLDYDFLPSGNDTINLFGTVICKRIPLVQQ